MKLPAPLATFVALVPAGFISLKITSALGQAPAAEFWFGIASVVIQLTAMSFAQIKEQVAGLTPDERLELAALIAHLSRTDEPQYQADLDRKLADMDAGKKFSQDDLVRLHSELTAKGE